MLRIKFGIAEGALAIFENLQSNYLRSQQKQVLVESKSLCTLYE